MPGYNRPFSTRRWSFVLGVGWAASDGQVSGDRCSRRPSWNPSDIRRLWPLFAGDPAFTARPGEKGNHDIGGMAVERAASPVVTHGRARVGVAGCFLHVPQRYPASRAAVMSEWRKLCGDPLGDPGPERQSFDGAVGGVAVDPASLCPEEYGTFDAFAAIEVEGAGCPGRQGHLGMRPGGSHPPALAEPVMQNSA